jgi:hypothetical protein
MLSASLSDDEEVARAVEFQQLDVEFGGPGLRYPKSPPPRSGRQPDTRAPAPF